MTATHIKGPVIQDSPGFMLHFMNLKQGRGSDQYLEVSPRAFYEIYRMWARAAAENTTHPNKKLTYLSGGLPIDYLSIIYTDSDNEVQISLSVEKIEL
jgi:hypothetical protein